MIGMPMPILFNLELPFLQDTHLTSSNIPKYTESRSDKSWRLLDSIHFSPPATNDSSKQNDDGNCNMNNASIASTGSRVPFSYAEITKIKPGFHNDEKPKVFDRKTKRIKTKQNVKNVKKNAANSKKKAIEKNANDNELKMPSISETFEPRKARRSRKRGSRLKRGAKKNWKNKRSLK